MPCSYQLDPAARLVRVEVRGTLSASEIIEVDDQLRRDPAFEPSFDQIVELLDATMSEVPSEVFRALLDRPPLFSKESRRAWIAPKDLDFGLARMFELRRGGSAGEIQVFRSAEDALAWLAEGGSR